MFQHHCDIGDLTIIGKRPNPLSEGWSEWTLVVCGKCEKLYEWQHHSEEQPHGGDLEVTAIVTPDYLKYAYGLETSDVSLIISKSMKIRCYNRYTRTYEERYA